MAPERIVRIGDKPGQPRYQSDNFWQMADTGPCGPCTEIFYDHGPDVPGGPPGSKDEDGDRYIEIWNLVFMQYDRSVLRVHGHHGIKGAQSTRDDLHAQGRIVEVVDATPPDSGPKMFDVIEFALAPLPAPCVDTGMGLERLAAVLQHAHSNYEIDLFAHLIDAAARLTNTRDRENKSLRVIADHIRACSFLIVDGVLPSNEGRGYVLRRITRRALRHGWMLGVRGEFFWKMVTPLVNEMGNAYPELGKKQKFVEEALRAEEQRFGETLEQGMNILNRLTDEERALSYVLDLFPGEIEREVRVGNAQLDGLITQKNRMYVVEVKRLSGSFNAAAMVHQIRAYVEELKKYRHVSVPVDGIGIVIASSEQDLLAITPKIRAANNLDSVVQL
ncbi:MAG: alanine--tRNA ligase-related protein, partial [Bryobacteraceae bacterium]